MKLQPRLSLDQIGHAPGRPKTRAVAQGFGADQQSAAQLLKLRRCQARFASGASGMFEGFGSVSFPRRVPAIGRLAMDAQFASHFGLRKPLLEEFGGRQSSPFQLLKVAFDAFGISHAQKSITQPKSCHYILRQSIGSGLPTLILCFRQ